MELVPPIWVPGMAIEDGMFTNRSTGNCDQHPWRVLSRLLCSSQPRTCWRAVLKSWRNLHPKKLAIKFPKLMATSQSLQHSALHQWVYQSLSLKPRFKFSISLVPNLPPKPRTQLSNRTYEAPLSLHQGSFYYLCMEPSARGGFIIFPTEDFNLGRPWRKTTVQWCVKTRLKCCQVTSCSIFYGFGGVFVFFSSACVMAFHVCFFKFWAKFPWHHSFAHVARGYSEMHLFKCWW